MTRCLGTGAIVAILGVVVGWSEAFTDNYAGLIALKAVGSHTAEAPTAANWTPIPTTEVAAVLDSRSARLWAMTAYYQSDEPDAVVLATHAAVLSNDPLSWYWLGRAEESSNPALAADAYRQGGLGGFVATEARRDYGATCPARLTKLKTGMAAGANSADAWYFRAYLEECSGALEGARDSYRHAADFAGADTWLGRLATADSLRLAGDLDAAVSAYRSVADRPDPPFTWADEKAPAERLREVLAAKRIAATAVQPGPGAEEPVRSPGP